MSLLFLLVYLIYDLSLSNIKITMLINLYFLYIALSLFQELMFPIFWIPNIAILGFHLKQVKILGWDDHLLRTFTSIYPL